MFIVLSAQTHQGPDADPLPGERGQSSAVPEGAEGPPGEHGFPRHRGRKPPPHAGPHLDHHPPLPGNEGAGHTRTHTQTDELSI